MDSHDLTPEQCRALSEKFGKMQQDLGQILRRMRQRRFPPQDETLRLGSVTSAQRDYDAAKTWYEKAFETHEKRGATNDATKICTALGNLCLTRVAGKRRDFAAAKKWFRKGLEIDDNATWRDWLILSARLWRYKLLSAFSK